jgi:hypothetical protein
MTCQLRTLALIAAVVAIPSLSYAQEVNLATLDEAEANHAFVRTGAEHGFVAGVGYGRGVELLGRTLLLSGELTAPWAGLDASDYRLRAGVLVPVVSFGGWKAAASLAPTLRSTKNELARMTGIGADGALTGGYYARRWFAAAELGADWEATTHVAHSDAYRTHAYANARDGWYSGPDDGNFRYGLQAGASIGRHDLVLRAGQLRTARGSKPLLPFYGTLAFNTRW